VVGHFVDERSGEIQTVAYRLPTPKAKGKVDFGEKGGAQNGAAEESEPVVVKIRPDVTQKGMAMIGELRTDALHTALGDSEIPIDTLLGILVIALQARTSPCSRLPGMAEHSDYRCLRRSASAVCSAPTPLPSTWRPAPC